MTSGPAARRLVPERGQALPLAAVATTFVAATVLGLAGLGAELAARGRAQAVADMVALASTAGPDAAEVVAQANHARLVGTDGPAAMITVTIELDGRRAVAAATTAPAVSGSDDEG